MKRFRHRLRHPRFVALAGRVVAWLLRVLGATWRLRSEGPDPFATGEPFVAALWHQNLLIAAWAFRDRGVVVPVSLSRDGDLIAAVLGHLRYAPPPRGSTSKGSLGLVRELVRAARGGHVVGILPDGPRGPAREAQPGVVAVARATGLPLVPMAAAARPAIRFRSWDRALLPLPFARVVRRYGSPIAVPKDLDEAGREAVRVRLARELDELTLDLEQRLGIADTGEPAGRH